MVWDSRWSRWNLWFASLLLIFSSSRSSSSWFGVATGFGFSALWGWASTSALVLSLSSYKRLWLGSMFGTIGSKRDSDGLRTSSSRILIRWSVRSWMNESSSNVTWIDSSMTCLYRLKNSNVLDSLEYPKRNLYQVLH